MFILPATRRIKIEKAAAGCQCALLCGVHTVRYHQMTKEAACLLLMQPGLSGTYKNQQAWAAKVSSPFMYTDRILRP
jgi:hypothetical protein